MITIERLCKEFPVAGKESRSVRRILAGVSFALAPGTFTTIFGPNGCGKSTLVNIIAGLDRATSGEVVGGAEIQRQVGYVFQDYRRSLLPWNTVRDNILFPLSLRGVQGREAAVRLDEMLDLTGIALDLDQRVYTLSGGQAQAVSILRALIIRPKLLILDEPFAALDYERTIALRRVISDASKALSLTVLCISHDLEEAIIMGDQVVFLTRPPTVVETVLPIPLPYPRTVDLLTTAAFVGIKADAHRVFERCCMTREE